MKAVGRTDVGNVRENNEDVWFLSLEPVGSLPNLFLVADGMGGHRAGEVASKNALDSFLEYIKNNPRDDGELLDCLTDAVAFANNEVYGMSLSDSSYYGMGTTFSACVISQGRAFIAHIGDSRIYIAKEDGLRQLTNDHTFVSEMVRAGQLSREEAMSHPSRNALTRALGVERGVPADAPTAPVGEGDVLLICSDGLSNMVSEKEITAILRSEDSAEAKADALVSRAKQNGGADNITVVVIEA